MVFDCVHSWESFICELLLDPLVFLWWISPVCRRVIFALYALGIGHQTLELMLLLFCSSWRGRGECRTQFSPLRIVATVNLSYPKAGVQQIWKCFVYFRRLYLKLFLCLSNIHNASIWHECRQSPWMSMRPARAKQLRESAWEINSPTNPTKNKQKKKTPTNLLPSHWLVRRHSPTWPMCLFFSHIHIDLWMDLLIWIEL